MKGALNMAKNKALAPKKKRSIGVRVFNILFIIIAVLLIAAAVCLFTPLKDGVWNGLKENEFAVKAWGTLLPYCKTVVHQFGMKDTFLGGSNPSYGIACKSYILLAVLALLAYLTFLPFALMHRQTKKGKKGAFRKVLYVIVFLLNLVGTLAYVAYAMSAFDMFKPYLGFIDQFAALVESLFAANGPLAVLVIPFLKDNLVINSLVYLGLVYIVIHIIFYSIAGQPLTRKEKRRLAQAEEKVEVAEIVPEVKAEEERVVPVVKLVEEEKKEEKEERVLPTVRELALLNSLEPIENFPVDELPGIYSTEAGRLVAILEPSKIEEVDGQLIAEISDAIDLSTVLAPITKDAEVLPGVDEWHADPWEEEFAVIGKERNSDIVMPGVDEWDAYPWERKAEPVDQPVEVLPGIDDEQTTPWVEEVKEPEIVVQEEPVVEEKKDEEPVVEETPVEETPAKEEPEVIEPVVVAEDVEDVTEVAEPEKVEEIVEEPVDETLHPVIIADNSLIDDGKRPQEEEHETSLDEQGTDRREFLSNRIDNSRDVVKTTRQPENVWIVPEYVEPEIVAEPEPVIKEDIKPVEDNKPKSNIKQVELKKVDTNVNRPHIVPLAPVAPVKTEEVKEEPVAPEVVVAPIEGPLHSIAKSKHAKIEKVEAKKVKFELKNYAVRAYDGDLTPEEAFKKGISKVSTVTINPVFANQAVEPEWKRKKREEDIKKNGYVNVETVKKLDGSVVSNKPSSPLNPTSIREMVKNQKASNAQTVEEKAVEEKPKIVKPIAPVSFKPVEKPVTENTSNGENKPQAPVFHPIAPIGKKENKRPEIKPVDPLKKK